MDVVVILVVTSILTYVISLLQPPVTVAISDLDLRCTSASPKSTVAPKTLSEPLSGPSVEML
jgi:hypothetical protein